MTLSLWMLLAFAGWTLLVLLTGVGVRRWSLIFTGRATLTSFPGGTPHGGVAYRRAVRAHSRISAAALATPTLCRTRSSSR